MYLKACVRLHTAWCTLCQRLAGSARSRGAPSDDDADGGQTTAEYALVIVGAATVAMLLLAWATGSGRIASLLNKVVDAVSDMVT